MGGEGDRFMEFWNNVFMQSNRDDEGHLSPLAREAEFSAVEQDMRQVQDSLMAPQVV